MRPALAAAVVVAGLSTAAAETIDGGRIVIIDGDTVAIPRIGGGMERIRLVMIDAPETWRPRCEAELVKGLEAKARLAELVRGAPVEVSRRKRPDLWGRTLAALATPAGDVGTILQAEGLAVRWRPGEAAWRARAAHWCGR